MRMVSVPFEAASTSFAHGVKTCVLKNEVGGAGKAKRNSTGCCARALPESSASAAKTIFLIGFLSSEADLFDHLKTHIGQLIRRDTGARSAGRRRARASFPAMRCAHARSPC